MTQCPSDQQLLCLLNEQLDGADEAQIVAHVDACPRCQERLDELTRSGEPHPSWIPPRPAWNDENGYAIPRPGRLAASPGTSGPPDSPPSAPPEGTVELARLAELPT